MQIFLYLCVGLASGLLGGMLGLGGGSIMVPAMVFLFGLTQHQAHGTSLAVLMMPIMIPAVWRYYVAGNVKIQMACFIALGFLVGGLLGAHWAQSISAPHLKKFFGAFLIVMGLKIVFLK
ncbi:MAG TPA: sulfite exporter TauE/SafE family protein [Candidatus Omnitrophota bacterium]|nr:sulfite exporter TauE/SafE family protein [Candidatus Omnitrophota bacterium]HPN87799.1 sulfite exporter TauE/SafE family protein [Candidatus Omnitrophota bacterium]